MEQYSPSPPPLRHDKGYERNNINLLMSRGLIIGADFHFINLKLFVENLTNFAQV